MKYWLLKTEPTSYSVDDLANEKNKTTCWDGVRNYQARNFIRDQMKLGDQALLYHSSTDPPGVVGICEVVKESYPDPSAFDSKSKYFDEQSRRDAPRWFAVDVKLTMKFKRLIPLDELRKRDSLRGMVLLTKGSRLSIQPVTKGQFDTIAKLA
jgi:predicted RNA-binding protein with PUA-like domain